MVLSGLPHEAAVAIVAISRRILAFFKVGYGPMLVKLLLVKLQLMLPTAANTVLLHQLC